MIDVHAEADAEGEDDADGEQVREYVDDDLQLCVERDGGHAEDVANGGNDRWGSGCDGCVDGGGSNSVLGSLKNCFAKRESAIVLMVSVLKKLSSW